MSSICYRSCHCWEFCNCPFLHIICKYTWKLFGNCLSSKYLLHALDESGIFSKVRSKRQTFIIQAWKFVHLSKRGKMIRGHIQWAGYSIRDVDTWCPWTTDEKKLSVSWGRESWGWTRLCREDGILFAYWKMTENFPRRWEWKALFLRVQNMWRSKVAEDNELLTEGPSSFTRLEAAKVASSQTGKTSFWQKN